MNIPSLPPFYRMIVAEENRLMSGEYTMYNDQLWQSLNILIEYFNNGVVFPSKTLAEIVAIEPAAQVGAVWFNTDTGKLQVKTSPGVIETITSI